MSPEMRTVSELERDGVLLVQDGNHGEYRPRRHEIVEDGTPHIRAADIRGDGSIDFDGAQRINATALARIRKGVGAPGDILLTHKGTVGRVGRVPLGAPHFVCSPQTTFWRCLRPDVLAPGFLYAYLRSPQFASQLRARMHESDMAPYVSLTGQRALEVWVPPLAKQEGIASVVGSLDRRIESNQRLAGLLAECCSTLFKRRSADAAEGTKSIYEIASVTYGAPFKSALFNQSEGMPLVRVRDVGEQRPSLRTPEFHPKSRVVRRGDIVVGMDGEFRAHAWAGPDALLNQRVCVFDPLPGVSRAFLLEAVKQPLAFFEATKGGTTVIHLGKRDIDTFQIAVPDEVVMRAFAEAVDPLLNLCVSLRGECRLLEEIREALLPKLVSGRIRVPSPPEDLLESSPPSVRSTV